MSADRLQLTAYLGERERVGGALLADELLRLGAEQQVATSVLLRGAGGFGGHHRLRTDRLLTLSEDLPLVAIALDSKPRIEALRRRLDGLRGRGLVTVEPARPLGPNPADRAAGEGPSGALKLTLVLGRKQRVSGGPAHVAACELLRARGVAGASVLLGVDGTLGGSRSRAGFFGRNAEVPTVVVAIGDAASIVAALPELEELLGSSPAALQPVRIHKRDGVTLSPPPGKLAGGSWQRLSLFSSESTLHRGRPLHEELIRRLRAAGSSGATAVRGIWGYHGADPPHGDRLLQLRRNVPVMTVTVDTPERIASAYEIADELTAEHGLVSTETVALGPADRGD